MMLERCPFEFDPLNGIGPLPLNMVSWYRKVRQWSEENGHGLTKDDILDWSESVCPAHRDPSRLRAELALWVSIHVKD